MPSRHDWLSRIKAVEREHTAVRQAADYFREAAANDPRVLHEDLRHRDIVAASANLEGTYVIRLFAEFETGARQYWNATWNTEPPTVDLLNGLGARCGIPDEQVENAHAVRKYRNTLVHERDDDGVEVLAIPVARGHLCRFFSFLPVQW
jgi:hypothetical protein